MLDRAVFESERLFQSRNDKVKILTCLLISDTTSVGLTVFLLAIYFVTLANTTSLVVIIWEFKLYFRKSISKHLGHRTINMWLRYLDIKIYTVLIYTKKKDHFSKIVRKSWCTSIWYFMTWHRVKSLEPNEKETDAAVRCCSFQPLQQEVLHVHLDTHAVWPRRCALLILYKSKQAS